MTAEADLVRLGEATPEQLAALDHLGEAVDTVRDALFDMEGFLAKRDSIARALLETSLAHVGDERMVLARTRDGKHFYPPTAPGVRFEDMAALSGVAEVIEVVVVRRTRRGDK